MSKDRLNGKTALVTGAAKRIGREIALALAGAGVNVAVHYRESATEANKLHKKLVAGGVKSWLLKADFDDAEAPARLISDALAAAGSLDILVNSASLFVPSTIQDMDFAGLTRLMQVNAWAPLVLSREFARRVGRGKIVNLLDSRIAGLDRSHAAYILSKRALAVLTEMMAVEFAPGITVNGVAPGLILPPPGKDAAYLDKLAKGLPLKRHGNPGDIADAVLYLLKSDFVTGQVVFVDGGRRLLELDLWAAEQSPLMDSAAMPVFCGQPQKTDGRRNNDALLIPPPPDRIIITDLRARCIVGVNEDERREKQDVTINLSIYGDFRTPGRTDRFEDAVDYRAIKKRVLGLVENSKYFLLEALAEAIASVCLATPGVKKVRVQVDKPSALRFARSVGVEIVRLGAAASLKVKGSAAH